MINDCETQQWKLVQLGLVSVFGLQYISCALSASFLFLAILVLVPEEGERPLCRTLSCPGFVWDNANKDDQMTGGHALAKSGITDINDLCNETRFWKMLA